MPKVLIVDDEEDILWGLSEELSRNGIDVDTASNGQEAFDKIKENDYDFLITDIRMPGMSGSELLLKSKNLRPDLKVVVMTAYGSDELKQEVLSHGAISYLEKPFDFEQLLELIKEKGKKVDETISKLSLNQFMQLVSMEGQSCIVTVKTDEGEGKVYFIDGEVVNAEFQNFSGEEAFIKLMRFQNPAFDVEWGVPQTKRLIEKPLHALLLAAVAKKEEEAAGVKDESELNEEEVDLSALSELFGEDEGVAEESVEEKVEEEKGAEEEVSEESGMELDLESLSFGEDEVVEEEVSEEKPEEEVIEEAQEEVQEGAGEEEVKEEEVPAEEEEFSLENLESMLEEEVEEEVSEEKPEEEVVEEAQEEVQEGAAEEEVKEEEFSLENLESMLEEEVEEEVSEEKPEEEVVEEAQEEVQEGAAEEEIKEEEVTAEEEVKEEVSEEIKEEEVPVAEEVKAEEETPQEEEVVEEEIEEVAEEEQQVKAEEKPEEEVQPAEEKEEAPEGEVKEEVVKEEAPQKGAPVISEDKIPQVEEVLRKIVALTTDIHAGFVADINGNLVASQFRSGNVKGDDLGYLGEYIGMIVEILKQVSGEDVEDVTIALKSENVIAAPALGGNVIILVATAKRTMKLALIKVELKKAVAKLNEELS